MERLSRLFLSLFSDMKNPISPQFYEASDPHGRFFEKNFVLFIMSREVYIPNFRSISFLVWSGGRVLTETIILKIASISGFQFHKIFEFAKDFRR